MPTIQTRSAKVISKPWCTHTHVRTQFDWCQHHGTGSVYSHFRARRKAGIKEMCAKSCLHKWYRHQARAVGWRVHRDLQFRRCMINEVEDTVVLVVWTCEQRFTWLVSCDKSFIVMGYSYLTLNEEQQLGQRIENFLGLMWTPMFTSFDLISELRRYVHFLKRFKRSPYV